MARKTWGHRERRGTELLQLPSAQSLIIEVLPRVIQSFTVFSSPYGRRCVHFEPVRKVKNEPLVGNQRRWGKIDLMQKLRTRHEEKKHKVRLHLMRR